MAPETPIPPATDPGPDLESGWPSPTRDHDHAQHAHELLDTAGGATSDHLTVAQRAQLDALRGIGHALLAIHQELVTRRAHGAGY